VAGLALTVIVVARAAPSTFPMKVSPSERATGKTALDFSKPAVGEPKEERVLPATALPEPM
jgi:hypothetical protein